jgi:hypothetical protein
MLKYDLFSEYKRVIVNANSVGMISEERNAVAVENFRVFGG